MLCQFPEHERLCRTSHWKVRAIHLLARALGVLVHIDAMPYGSARNLPRSTGGVNQSPTCSSC